MFIREKEKKFEKMMSILQKHHDALTERSKDERGSAGS